MTGKNRWRWNRGGGGGGGGGVGRGWGVNAQNCIAEHLRTNCHVICSHTKPVQNAQACSFEQGVPVLSLRDRGRGGGGDEGGYVCVCGGGGGSVRLLVAQRPSNMLDYLRDGSAQTIRCADSLR